MCSTVRVIHKILCYWTNTTGMTHLSVLYWKQKCSFHRNNFAAKFVENIRRQKRPVKKKQPTDCTKLRTTASAMDKIKQQSLVVFFSSEKLWFVLFRNISKQKDTFHFFLLFFIRAIFKLYICIPTNCTQLIYFINNTLKHMYCLKL